MLKNYYLLTMETKDFLREKGLLSEDKETFRIIQENENEFELNQLLEEWADIKWKDQYLRLASDFENYKRRSNSEKEDLVRKTKMSTLNSVLDLNNDMTLAYKMLDDESKETVEIFIQKMSSFLTSQGIEEIQTDVYDSDLHEVVHVIESGESKIVDVISKGYKINDKVVKYPKIVLSK